MRYLNPSNVGLAVYVLSVLIGAAVLAFDATLAARGERTITQWAAVDPVRWWWLFLAVLVGPCGLLLHFATFRD